MRAALCHPDKKHFAKDFCKTCYTNQYNKKHPRHKDYTKFHSAKWRSNPENRAKEKIKYNEWRLKNLDKVKAQNKNTSLLTRFGIDLEEYTKMLAAQNGSCKICKKPETAVIRGTLARLAVDHNHLTGEVRGLLCLRCNTGIAFLDNNPGILPEVLKYMEGL